MKNCFVQAVTVLGILCASCLGCSSVEELQVSPDEASAPPQSVNVFMARGSLFASPEFEQYRLSGSTLFVECGQLRGSRPVARGQLLLPLSEEEQTKVQTLSTKAAIYLRENSRALEEPGDASGFMDPGILEVSIRGAQVSQTAKTSLDAISSAPRGLTLRKLVTTMRSLARDLTLKERPSDTPLCGNATFYGFE